MPQEIDVPGMGVVEFPDGMSDADMSAAIQRSLGQTTAPAPAERPFTERLGRFFRNVYENPPPTVAAIRDVVKGAPAAAQELTWGADPEAAKQAAGTMLGAASLAVPSVRAMPLPQRAPIAPQVAAPSEAQTALQAASRLNVDVPRYLATEGTAIPQFAQAIRQTPWAGEPIVQSAQRFGERLGEVKGEIGPAAVSPEIAGETARKGIASWIKSGSQEPVRASYRTVDELIDPNVMVPLENTAMTVRDIIAERVNARIPGTSRAADVVMQAIQGPMDYQGIKRLRTYLGEKTPQELAVSGINPAEAKRLYGALTQDLTHVVREAGGESGAIAWQEANALARLTNMQRQALSRVIGSTGEAAPEAVFARLLAYAGSRSSADLNRLRLARRAMGPAAWNEVGSALIGRLGMAPDGGFSADRFVTAFGNLAPAAKRELFSAPQLAALNDLATVSRFARDRITRFGNPSGTGRTIFGGVLGSALWIDPMSAIVSVVGNRLAAEALSRPAVIRAATQVARTQAQGNPIATRNALIMLYQVAGREGLIRDEQQRSAP